MPVNSQPIVGKFERLRQSIILFLGERQDLFPEVAVPISRIKSEIESSSLPGLIPDPLRLPGCKHLPAALDMAQGGCMEDLANAFAEIEPDLKWIRTEHYRKSLGDDYMENYGYTNILGYDALIPHDRVIAAFFVIGPGRHYPRHHHEAEEVYFPFGGDTLWIQNDETPKLVPAGHPVHNTPWLPHEMITQESPLFTFCFWISPGPIQLAELTD